MPPLYEAFLWNGNLCNPCTAQTGTSNNALSTTMDLHSINLVMLIFHPIAVRSSRCTPTPQILAHHHPCEINPLTSTPCSFLGAATCPPPHVSHLLLTKLPPGSRRAPPWQPSPTPRQPLIGHTPLHAGIRPHRLAAIAQPPPPHQPRRLEARPARAMGRARTRACAAAATRAVLTRRPCRFGRP